MLIGFVEDTVSANQYVFNQPKLYSWKTLAFLGHTFRKVILAGLSVGWLWYGFLDFGLIPLLTIWNPKLLGCRVIFLNWARLNQVFNLFFTDNSNTGWSDMPPPLTNLGWMTLIGISFILTGLALRNLWREGTIVKGFLQTILQLQPNPIPA